MKSSVLDAAKFFAVAAVCSSSALAAGSYIETFDSSAPTNFTYGSGGNKAAFTHISGYESPDESGTKVLLLELDPTEKAGAWQGPNYTSKKMGHFGRYVARIKTASARGSEQPKAGAVVGFYTYYNDKYGSAQTPDINGNGIPDNSEIDFEWLIADPRIVYMTAYTDFNDETGKMGKVNRTINLATGKIISTTYANSWSGGARLTGDENLPETIPAIEGYDASAQFYTYGFDWMSDHIRWWIVNPKDEKDTITLWDYRGPKERITQKPASLMINFWHTNDWSVEGVAGSTEAPRLKFQTQIDWASYTPEEEIPVAESSSSFADVPGSSSSVINSSSSVAESSSSESVDVLKAFLPRENVNESVDVFDLNGQFMGKFSGSRENILKGLPNAGVYLLRFKNQVKKIRVSDSN
ncbi:MAG: T9SS type A sorting domain-containing protein [Fibrobacter sp.]|nr:T9SS type A sorting domain-containing protein [Fibrobacter sp.]